MHDGASAFESTAPGDRAPAGRGAISLLWPALAALSLALAIGAIAARVAAGARFDGFLIFSAGFACAVIAFRLLVRDSADSEASKLPAAEPIADLFESAGPGIVSVSREGRLIYINPSAERLLGYHAEELRRGFTTFEILGPGEGARMVAEMQRLCGIERPVPSARSERLEAYMECARNLPPSRIPSFEVQLRRKDGEFITVTLQASAMRDESGGVAGLVAVALEPNVSLDRDQAHRESQERFKDLFENSSEMIATLNPAGKFLYANPAWKRCFGKDISELTEGCLLEDLFSAGSRGEVAALFRRALEGEQVDRALLRHHSQDGRIMEFELSLSQRQNAGNPLAIRCLMREVTQQKQREHRLALQLVVSQIVGENASSDVASMRILEALCVSQGWDMAVKWSVNEEEKQLEFSAAWAAPGRRAETFIQESMGVRLPLGGDLAGRAWEEGHPVWLADLSSAPISERIETALSHEMVSGWAVPVREGNKVLAVLEFYCHFSLREEPEALASIETVAASMGQMLARSQERGRAEELFRQQEILLDSVADGICGVDRHGVISFANPAAARLLGVRAEAVTGRPVHELLHGAAPPESRCGRDCPLNRSYDTREGVAGEDSIFRADGSGFTAEYALIPISDQGHFSGYVLSFRDITQRYALDRLKDEFISTVSHELRTPLTSIRGALGLLASGNLIELNEKSANLVRIALSNSERLVRLINDILDLERIQSGREPLAVRPVQLGQLIKQAIEGMAPVADAAGVQLIHDTTQVEIEADADRLLQVLTNLLSNAVKFSPPHSTVSVMLRPEMSGVTLSVIDQGRGIPADKLETIFGRFQQVDASDSRQKGGSGLGLAICRTILNQHAGRIWAERNPVRGSTFRAYLPYKQPPTDQPKAGVDREAGHGTILLADAGPASRPHISNLLASHGYRVVETTSVEETLAAAHGNVQTILLNTAPTAMNGWEILPLMRKLRPKAKIPIVLMSVEMLQEVHGLAVEPEPPARDQAVENVQLAELGRALCLPGENVRILIVEADRGLATAICGLFAREGIETRHAADLQEALDACFHFQPHLLMLDMELPDGDGFNLVDWLRKHDGLGRLPLIVYSGLGLRAEDCRKADLGPAQFLAKAAIRPQQLEALVLTMLRTTRTSEDTPLHEASLQHPGLDAAAAALPS